MVMEQRFLTIKELASILKCDRTTIGRALRSGKIQGFKIGSGVKSSWRILETEISRMQEFDLQQLIETEVNKRFIFSSRSKNDEEKLTHILQRGKLSSSGCLEWQLACDKDGYGITSYKNSDEKGRCWKVHRLIWVLTYGDIQKDKLICHTCDNPKCFNIDHLFIGAHKDNSQDRELKGRGRTQHQNGEKNHAAKLTKEIVLSIREMHKNGKRECDIMREFNLNQATMSKILLRKRWKHV